VHKAPVIPLGCVTKLNLDPDLILEANKGKLSGFLLIGFDHDGEEYFAATYSDGGTAMWLLERCKKRLMDW
jgi:intein/homing endonuclease